MGILDRILADRIEYNEGRIRDAPCNWVFEPTEAQIKRTMERNPYTFHESIDATGRKMYLIHQRSVQCPCPDVGEGKYPQSDDSKCWFVPQYVCRKCPHYNKPKRRRYATCAWARQQRGGVRQAVQDVQDVMDSARKTADEIINGRSS